MGIHAFMRRDEPFWTCCRTCGNRDGDRCTAWDADIRWPRDWYGCGSYVVDGNPYPTQTLLDGWAREPPESDRRDLEDLL